MESDYKFLENFVLSENKQEALKLIPESASFKPLLKYFLQMQSEDILEKISNDFALSADHQKQLKLAQILKNLENEENIDETLKSLTKNLQISFDFPPPKDLLNAIGSN